MLIHQPLCPGTLFCLTAQELRHSYLPSLLCFQLYHIPPGAQWFMAMASNLLPTISACGGWDGVSSSQLTIGFSTDKLLRRETNLPAWASEPASGPLCNATTKAPCWSPYVNIEGRCCPYVGLIFPSVRGGGKEFLVCTSMLMLNSLFIGMRITFLSCAASFSLKAARLGFTCCSRFA